MKKNKSPNALNFLLKYFLCSKKTIILTAFIMVFAVCLGRIVTFLNAYLIDNVIANSNLQLLIVIALVVFALLLIEALFYFFQNIFFSTLGYKVASDIRLDIYKKILGKNFEYFENNCASGILSRCTLYVNELGNFFMKNFLPFMLNLLKFVAVYIFMLVVNWKLALIILSIIAVIVLCVILFNKISFAKNKKFKENEIERDKIIVDSVYGMEDILMCDGKEKQVEKFADCHKRLNSNWLSFCKINEAFLPVIEGLWFCAIIIVYVFSFNQLQFSSLELGVVITFIGYIMQTTDPISLVALNYQAFINIQGTLNKIYEIFDNEPIKTKSVLQVDAPFDIELSNLNYNHGKGIKLEAISLKIKEGEKVLINGNEGSGKTPLAYIIAGLYTQDSGQATINNKSIAEINPQILSQIVGIVTSEVHLVEGTIKDNILLNFSSIDSEQLDNIIKELNIEQYVNLLPNKMQTIINDDDIRITKSLRQLIGLARVYVKEPKIIILDEALFALDDKNAKTIIKSLENFAKNKTLILLSTKQNKHFNYDQTIILSSGKIAK